MKLKQRYDTKSQKESKRIKTPQLKGEAHPQLTPQASKVRLVQRFGEDIGKLELGVNVPQIDVPFLNMVTKKMEANINMLCFRMKHGILGDTDGTGAIA